MRLLLDTHALLWWLADDRRLGAHARDLIADPANDVLVSSASLWEIAVKVRIGKLRADVAAVAHAVGEQSFLLLDIKPEHLAVLSDLPLYPDHRDPFDHLLVAQAIAESAGFLSDDVNASRYPVAVMSCASHKA